jgi:hypothetical protein
VPGRRSYLSRMFETPAQTFRREPTLAYPNEAGWQPSGPPPPIYVSVPPTNGMAIAALILVFVFVPLGIIFGHVARGQIKRTREGGRGLATAALVIGYLQVAVMVAVIGVAAILVALGAQ